MKEINKFKPTLFMNKNGDCVNIIWLDDGVSIAVGDNDQGYFFNKNEWDILNEMLKPTRYVQDTKEDKPMQKLILDTIEEAIKQMPDKLVKLMNDFKMDEAHKAVIASSFSMMYEKALTNAFEAGQKSREKEIVEKIKNSKTPEKLIKEQYECYDFDEAEVYALENEIIENIIKSLSLTKESK